MKAHWGSILRLLAGSVVIPPAAMSAFLVLTHDVRVDHSLLFLVVWGLSVGAGLWCVMRLPIPDPWLGLLGLLYVPIMAVSVIVYSLYFVGVVYGDWL